MLELDGDDRVTGYREKPTLGYCVSMGIYVYESRVLEHLPDGPCQFPDLVQLLLEAGEHVAPTAPRTTGSTSGPSASTSARWRSSTAWKLADLRRALITGITGQDGSYLAELLLDKGYEVHGMVRRSSTERFERIEHLRDRITLHQGDLLDQRSLVDALRACRPDEVYNLAAMSFVAVSWIQPTLTAEFTGVGVDADARGDARGCPEARFYQASSSEMFGKVRETPQNEETPFYPRVAVRRGQGVRPPHHGQLPRESTACTHARESVQPRKPRRGLEFVTRKITWHAAAIKLGLADELRLGNLDAKRDWGYAPTTWTRCG